MATKRTRRTAAVTPVKAVTRPTDFVTQIEYVDITDITPYEWNARDNTEAVSSVRKSIENFGFLVPCVIDSDNVLVAGHTRVEAAKEIGMLSVPCIRANHLSENAIRQFRLIDNKVSEIAKWDEDLLASEIAALLDEGMDFTGYGWTEEAIDCMRSVVEADCLTTAEVVDAGAHAARNHQERRAPLQARIVIGDFTFFVPRAQYQSWADGIRHLCDYSEEDVARELKTRLGILD